MMKEKQEKRDLTAYRKTRERQRVIVSGGLAFLTVNVLPFMLQLPGEQLAFTNSFLTVFLFAGLWYLLERVFRHDFEGKKRRWLFPGIFGGLFSFCMVAGRYLEMQESVPFSERSLWLAIVVLGGVSTILVRYFWDILGSQRKAEGESQTGTLKPENDKAGNREKENDKEAVTKKQKNAAEKVTFSYRSWLLRAGVIFLCYVPVFLAVYPGFFVYDAQDEYLQVVTRNFTTHHPLLHVLLLGGIIQLVFKLTGSYNLGIACYTVFQMLVMAGIFSWCVEKLKAQGMKKTGQVLLTLYFGLCPVLVMFSLCSAKDGLFTGMLLIMVVLLQELFEAPEQFFKRKGNMVLFALAALFMMLLRHNGFYAFLVFTPFAVAALKKYWKKVSVYLVLLLALYWGADRGLTFLFSADASENQEMLTVPIMQMARVYNTAENLPEEEKEILHRYLPKESLERYVPKVSDGVKISFDNEAYAKDKGSFLKLWIKWGIENPFTYANAWFMTSYGFWYPDTVIDVYRGNTVFTYTYEDSSYFGYEVEEPGTRESKLPALNELYRKMSLEIFQQKIPVVSMLFSPGAMFWVMMFLVGFLCYVGSVRKTLAFLLPILVWLTVILGPTYLVRYVVFLWTVVVLLLWEVKKYISSASE